METRHNFSRMLTMAKVLEELFTPTLNRLAVCVRCVHSINLDDNKQRKLKTVTPFPKWDMHIKIQSQSWICYGSVNQSIVYVTIIYANQKEKYIYGSKKHPYTRYPAAKHPKHSKLSFTNTQEKPEILLVVTNWGATLASAKTLLCKSFCSRSIFNSLTKC